MSTIDQSGDAVRTARDYYNSADADSFYAIVWGGEDIHIGIYQSPDESIVDASRRTIERMAARLSKPTVADRVLDLGSGYCGAARYLARTFGCQVTALNLSEVENDRARALNQQAGLGHLIEVVDGSFEEIPFEDASFQVVWSQDAILHSGRRAKVMMEAARVLAPGGQLIFTDPMQDDGCPVELLQPILDRIHLGSLASPLYYEAVAEELGLELVSFEELTPHLTNHYRRVLEETRACAAALEGKISAAYLERMKKGLQHWIEGGQAGHLAWGIFHFKKR